MAYSKTLKNQPPKLSKEQMLREMREAAASTAKVKAPKSTKKPKEKRNAP